MPEIRFYQRRKEQQRQQQLQQPRYDDVGTRSRAEREEMRLNCAWLNVKVFAGVVERENLFQFSLKRFSLSAVNLGRVSYSIHLQREHIYEFQLSH